MNAPVPARLVNIPNALTALRLVLVPVFVLVMFTGGGHDPAARWIAGAIFAFAALTDRLDGQIARQRGQVTNFGKIADPIADKALIGAALIGLSILGEIFWWITIVLLVREVGITVLRFAVLRYGVISASPGGKLKTVLQIVAVGLYVLPILSLPLPLPATLVDWVRGVLMGIAILLTLATGIDYLVRATRLVKGSGRDSGADAGGDRGGADS